MLNSNGTIEVRTFTAGSALPVEGSTVRILGAEEPNRTVAYSLITDVDGATGAVALPTADIEFSLSPSPAETPYALYDIEVSSPGYYSKKIYGVAVFSGVDTVQSVAMIPKPSSGNQRPPLGNIDAIIPQNERLE